MHYVYILKSQKDRSKFYIGETIDLAVRLKQHNKGMCSYSRRFAPWSIETYITFSNAKLAKEFERYLKTGSGKAFLKRRLMA